MLKTLKNVTYVQEKAHICKFRILIFADIKKLCFKVCIDFLLHFVEISPSLYSKLKSTNDVSLQLLSVSKEVTSADTHLMTWIMFRNSCGFVAYFLQYHISFYILHTYFPSYFMNLLWSKWNFILRMWFISQLENCKKYRTLCSRKYALTPKYRLKGFFHYWHLTISGWERKSARVLCH